ncbi:MAG: hypothetical protein IPN59_00915 [Holophaga sp.]|nr:hypothetical protein [Holophaga sp.]
MKSDPRLALPRARGTLLWLVGLLVIVGACGAWFYWGPLPAVGRAPIVLALGPEETWEGITPTQRIGLLLLLKDHLEVINGQTVVEEPNLAGPPEIASSRVVLSGRRMGDSLSLDLRVLGAGAKEERWTTPLLPPTASFENCLVRLHTKLDPDLPILPKTPAVFWDLTEATGYRIDQDPAPGVKLAQTIVNREPTCGGGWATLAVLSYWQLYREAAAGNTESFSRCEGLFRKAFALIPHYPRAVDDFAGFKTDVGSPREALDACFAALRRYPKVAHLHSALAYPARISGLLEGATRALRARDALLGSHRFERDTVENTHLYLGDWDHFERMLGPGSETTNEPSRDFYRGYIKLAKGRPDLARPYFVRAQRLQGSWIQFETLAHIFEQALSDNREGALKTLRQFKLDRTRLRVPDGEFTFKLAEAFAFLGDYEEATETAVRANAQGFGCTRWYQESPFLAQVPRQARWNALMQHLRERQQLMEQTFPANRFGR